MTWRWALAAFAVALVAAVGYVALVLVHLARAMTVTVTTGEVVGDDLDAIVGRLTLILRPKEQRGA